MPRGRLFSPMRCAFRLPLNLSLAACLLLSTSAFAVELQPGSNYRVRFRGGQQLRAKVVSATDTSVVLLSDQGTLRIPRERIDSATPLPDTHRIGEDREIKVPGSELIQTSPWRGVQLEALQLSNGGHFGEALNLIVEEILPQSPATAWRQAADIIQTMEKTPVELEDAGTTASRLRSRDAQFLLLALNRLSTRADTDQFAMACLQVGNWMAATNQPEPLGELARLLDPLDADRAALLHHLSEYLKRLSQLPPGDYSAAYRLGKWAAERGLDRQVRDLMTLCSGHPDFGPNARMHLEILDRRAAKTALQDIRDRAMGGSRDQLQRSMEVYEQKFADSPYINHLWHMAEVQKLALQRQSADQSLTRAAGAQDLERLEKMGDFPALLMAAQRIIAEQPGTELAAVAGRYELRARTVLKSPDSKAQTFAPPSSDAPPAAIRPEATLSPSEQRQAEIEAMARQASREANRRLPSE